MGGNLRRAATVAAGALVAAIASAPAWAEWPGLDRSYEATWDKIRRTGVVQTGCMAQPPYWQRDAAGTWKAGWGIEANKDMAAELEVKWECVETTWGTAALGIQSGKMDLLWAMQATPKRATAVTFVGPLYNHGFMMLNRKGFRAKNWVDYDKPEVKVAVTIGTSMALVRKFVAPNATALELQDEPQTHMAVISGRADAVLTTVINGILYKARNPEIGEFVIPQPLFSFPAYVGLRNEPDARFRDFTHWWAEWVRLQGKVEAWIKGGLVEMGVPADLLPDKLYF